MRFDVSSREEVLDKRLFLEASAGTGKTFAIEHYIVRSILTGELIPSKLFLVTFTRAVADELTVRLKKTLEETGKELLTPSNACPDYLVPYLQEDEFQRRQYVRKIEEALSRLYEATISTIHVCCDRLLSLWEDGDEKLWISDYEQREWVVEYLRAQTLLSYGEWKTLGKRYSYDEKAIVDALKASLQNLLTPIIPLEEAVEETRKRLDCLEQISFSLQKKARQCRGTTNRQGKLHSELIYYFDAIEKLIQEGCSDTILASLQGVDLGSLFTSLRARSEKVSEEISNLVEILLSFLWPSLLHYTLSEGIVRRLSIDCEKRFSLYLELSGKKTPESVVQKTVALSKTADFCAMAAEVVDYLIVDEFQDTDASQWEIFSKLFIQNPLWRGSVLIVGDPKQAIYGFRKADVYSYFAAKESFSSFRTLSVNYRANPKVVQALNRLFSGPELFPLFYLPKLVQGLCLERIDSGKREEELCLDARGALHLFVAKGSIGRKRRWPHEALETEHIFPWLADEMISLEQKGTPFRSQAILVRDRYQAKRVQRFLQERKIPTCAWKVDKVTESPLYQWLYKAFLLAAQPSNQKRLASLLLLFPTLEHKTLCQLIAISKRLDQWALCVKEWIQVQEAFYKGGIGAMAKALFSALWDGVRSTDEWLSSLSHQAVIDVEHLFELLSLLEKDLPPSLESLAEALLCLESRFSQNPELLLQRIDPDDDGAPILTIHKSKGLEFEVVFALGCACRTPLQEDIEEGEAEKIRQLYVSVTRAKRRCYLPILLEEDGKKIPLGTASPLELLFAGLSCKDSHTDWLSALYGKMEKSSLLKVVETLSREETITHSFVEKEERGLSVLKKKRAEVVQSFSPLRWTRNKYCSFSSMRRDEHLISSLRGDGCGALFGTQFHAAIATLLFEPLAVRSSLAKIEERVDSSLGSLLYKALGVELILGGEKVSLHEIERDKMKVEVPFLDRQSDGLFCRGSIDLLFEWKGAIYIIDWKTNLVDKDPSQYVVEHGYDLQARLYKEAAHRAYTPHFRWGGFFFVFVRSSEGVHYVS